jgi:SAM-dependent methyltransferase
VIDLHNGALRPTRTVRPAVRILRRFARSVCGLPVPRRDALGFACRLLKAAGYAAADRRRVISRVPPIDTHGRYEVPGRAAAYRGRSTRRTTRELELLHRIWPGRPGELVLDSPAGAGRLAASLGGLGARRIGADRAMAMLGEARRAGDSAPLIQADAAALPFRDRSVDGVVVFRFLHHLEESAARQVVLEAARVADRFLVVSFFHPLSVHGLRRRLREGVHSTARTRFTLCLGQLRGWLAGVGFEPTDHAAERRFLRDFWVAGFERARDPGEAIATAYRLSKSARKSRNDSPSLSED